MRLELNMFGGVAAVLGSRREVTYSNNTLAIGNLTLREAQKVLDLLYQGMPTTEEEQTSHDLMHSRVEETPVKEVSSPWKEVRDSKVSPERVAEIQADVRVEAQALRAKEASPPTEAPKRRGRPPKVQEATPTPPPAVAVPVAPSPGVLDMPPPDSDGPPPELNGEPIPASVVGATRWEVLCKYLGEKGYEPEQYAEVLAYFTPADIPLLGTVDPEFVQECIDVAVKNLANGGSNTLVPTSNTVDVAELMNFEMLRPVIQYLLDHGVLREGLVAACERYKDDVPALKNIANIEKRVNAMLEAMFGEGA